jgi:glutamyl-tRNA reductase
MSLLLVGMNHRTASIAEREALALDDDAAARVLADVLQNRAAREALVLSTCNRTEIYAVGADSRALVESLRRSIVTLKHADLLAPSPSLYQLQDGDAVRHVFRVAAGIDSMVLGEAQIQSQLKDAYALARDLGATGPTLDRLFESALRTGKRARAETAIGAGVVSVASAACELARRAMTSLDGRHVLVVGVGETTRIAVRHLAQQQPRRLTIVNRTLARAQSLAAEVNAVARPLDQIGAAIADADLVFAATRAPGAIISAETVREAMAIRANRPILIVDLAMPRDVEPEVATIEGVTLHSIDAIQGVVDQNLARRAAEVPRVDAIVAEEVTKFDSWHRSLEAAPVVRDLRDHFERVRAEELQRLFGNVSSEERARAERLTQALVNRLLHLPTVRLKDADPASDEGLSRLRAARELFALNRDEVDQRA